MPAVTAIENLKYIDLNNPPQGSDAWLQKRKKIFGSSDIASLMGQGYKTREQLIQHKNEINPSYVDNAFCRFGNLFELVTKWYLKKELHILNFGSIRHKTHMLAASPDGVVVINDNELMLVEIKCPVRRKVRDNVVPEIYKWQLQTALMCIPSSNKMLFLDMQFRICSIKQHGWNPSFNRRFHKASYKTYPDTIPKMIGYIRVFNVGSRDYGADEEPDIPNHRACYYRFHYGPLNYQEPDTGYLCFKLFKRVSIEVSPDAGIQKNILQTVEQYQNQLPM